MLFEKIVNEVFDDYTFPMVRTVGHLNGYNCYSEDDNIIVEVNAAGIKKKDINVNVADDRLTVKSEDKLNKVISLPKNADVDNITGSHIDGMLKLTIPLTNKTRKIKIK
tara:strand:- start:1670 stop:1996 length:327 start_codon:yes stop_codon:yes gene_type:complete